MIPAVVAGSFLFNDALGARPEKPSKDHHGGTTSSGPIQITSDDQYIWVANPDNDSVSLIEVGDDVNTKVTEILVGQEPQNVAIHPNGRYVYVSNTAENTVTVLRVKRNGGTQLFRTIVVGTDPYGMALTPNGEKLYVANARSNNVSVIETKNHSVIATIDGVGLEPRGIAITNNGDRDDDDEKVYVTQFLAVDRTGATIGADDYKEGRVTVISAATDNVIGEVVLNPMADTGFRAAGDALGGVAPGADFTFTTGAFPNMLNNIVIKGNRAYVPNTAASPNGPVRFNVNLQAFLSVIDVGSDSEDESQTINMNRGINFEPAGEGKVFLAVPWAAAFKHASNEGYVVAACSNLLVRVELDGDGAPTINAPEGAGDPGGIQRIFVGQNPRGLVINSEDTRAYVMNEVSRDVSVVDLDSHEVIATIRSAPLPPAGSSRARLLIGKAVFNSSTGVNLPELGVNLPARLSSEGWSACFSCHPFGWTDGVVWMFGAGPRRTLPLNGTFNRLDNTDIKILNHSGIRDEVQDFELNIRAVSGGLGLITEGDGTTPDPTVTNFGPPTTGRSQFLDDMTFYISDAVRTPVSPLEGVADQIGIGRDLFEEANCASCHGGAGWSSSRRNFEPPPDASLISNGQIVSLLKQVGTFDPDAPNEVRDNASPALGADGYVPPSLMAVHAFPPYLHNGSAATLEDVLELVPHRTAGTAGVDLLTSAADRAALATFLRSIDKSVQPFDIGPHSELDDSERSAARGTGTLHLDRVYPNPTREGSTIAFSLPKPGPVQIDIYNVLGQRVVDLVNEVRPAGQHLVQWDGRNSDGTKVWSGIYYVRVQSESETAKSVIVILP
jgi:YVTN family beta-propeller protein